jgi:hypothetical protein
MAIDLSKYGEPAKATSTKKGLDLSKYGEAYAVDVQEPKKDGFFPSVYKSLAAPVANLIARPGQAVQSALGQEVSTGKFLGLDITEPKTFKDTLKDVGRGLETVSLGIGGSGGVKALTQGLKGKVLQGAKEGLKYGLPSGALGGGGASMEYGNDFGQVFKDTLMGGAVGSVAGSVLGGGIPAVAGGVRKAVKPFSDSGAREELGNVFRETASKYVRPQAILDQAQTVSQTDPVGVLQLYGGKVVPTMEGGSARTTEGVEFLKQKIKDLSELRNEDLFLNNTRVPIPSYRQYANELLDSMNWSEAKKAAVRNDLTRILDDVETAYKDSPKNVDGVELSELTRIKTEQTGKSKSYNNPNSKFDYDAHSIAGKAARDLVELTTDSPSVKDLNKFIQSHYDAIDFLDSLNGKKVKGGAFSKGLSKIGGDVIGAVAGSATAGLPGGVVGGIAGRAVAGQISDIIQSRFITNPIKRLLIDNLKEQAPKEVTAVLKTLETKYKDIFDEMGFSQSLNRKARASTIKTDKTTTASKAIDSKIPQSKKKSSIPNKEGGFISIAPYKEKGNLTTKILKDLEGKTTVSKQYILDATNRGEVKQIEKDLIRDLLETEGKDINVAEFAEKVKSELLPLKVESKKFSKDGGARTGSTRYESITLPDELRGDVANYKENIYESPIATSAGETHFPGKAKNYFGHTRVEDMADGKTRRVIEVQSDLFQKGRIEEEFDPKIKELQQRIQKDEAVIASDLPDWRKEDAKKSLEYVKNELESIESGQNPRQLEKAKLAQYNNPTAHFRMVREEMRRAAQDKRTKLQFPTGETAMKIEGLGENSSWADISQHVDGDEAILASREDTLSPDQLKVGQRISRVDEGIGSFDPDDSWIVTDVLENGKFKAVPKERLDGGMTRGKSFNFSEKLGENEQAVWDRIKFNYAEEFDISGEVDTNNPIYRFYEKDLQKYLTKFGGKRVVDDNGVSWIEVPVDKKMAKTPVEAFGKIGINPLTGGALVGAGLAGASEVAKLKKGSKFEYTSKETPKKEDNGKLDDGKLTTALLELESSMMKNRSSEDEGEKKWVTGLTDIAIKELKRTGVKKKVDINDEADVVDASVKYFNLLQDRHPSLTPAEVYVDRYWTQAGTPEQRKKKIEQFNKIVKGG